LDSLGREAYPPPKKKNNVPRKNKLSEGGKTKRPRVLHHNGEKRGEGGPGGPSYEKKKDYCEKGDALHRAKEERRPGNFTGKVKRAKRKIDEKRK